MELLGKIQDIQSHCKGTPSQQSLLIAAEASVEFFEEISSHMPIDIVKWVYDEISAVYNIKRQFLKEKLENDTKNTKSN